MTDRLHTFQGTSFGGVPMAQYFCDLYLWEVILNEMPEAVAVVEIGSWRGGLSLYLRAQCDARGIAFWCMDVYEPDQPIRGFERRDIWRDKAEINARLAAYPGPVVLFCDNGNKPRELREFTRDLPKGSLVAVHDWGTETLPSDIPEWLEETMGNLCDEIGSVTRVFTVRDE